MSRSLRQYFHRQHHRGETDALPTPPSLTSTPQTPTPPLTAMTDGPPPRKRIRCHPPISVPDPLEMPIDTTVDQRDDHVIEPVRIPRIRIKMASEGERRSSVRLAVKSTLNDVESGDMGDDEFTASPAQEPLEVKEESWDDREICEMVDPMENWRVIGLSNVGNTCFTNAILQVFSQTEILGEYFIRRQAYFPPPLTLITNPFTSADLTSRATRSKTRRNQATEQEIPIPSAKSLCSSFSRLLRALHPSLAPPAHRRGVTYHQPKKHRSDIRYSIAPREFIGTFNSVYPTFRKGQSQEDAMEFFSRVRERLHDELRADLEVQLRNSGTDVESNEQWLMNQSPISDTFRGYCVTKRICTVCNTARDAPLEETWQLPVAVPCSSTPAVQTYSLSDLIAHYGGVEKDVNVECCKCGGNTPHDSRPSYLQIPRVLVIQALRFVVPKTAIELTSILDTESVSTTTTGTETPPATDSSDASLPTTRRARRRPPPKRKVIKNPAHITFPLTGLDMTSYLRSESAENEVYDLFAVVEHVGHRMDGGHYIAYVRGKDALGKDVWWKCNDAKCWMVAPETVSSAHGYIWFYERQTQRGVVPDEWGDVVQETDMDNVEAHGNMGFLATPESGPAEMGEVIQNDTKRKRDQDHDDDSDDERKRNGFWEGRLQDPTALDG